MILQDGYFDRYCEICDKRYAAMKYKWCELCQTSGNKQIDIVVNHCGKVEWIPYNQLTDIKKIGNGGFAAVYSAIWKNNDNKNKKKVALKCLYNSQNITKEFLSEVCTVHVLVPIIIL